MRLISATILGLVALASVSASYAQQSEQPSIPARQKVGWTVDPATGTMHAVLLTGKSAAPAGPLLIVSDSGNTATYTGTVNINITIKLISALPKDVLIRCNGTASLQYSVEQTSGNLEFILGGNAENAEAVEALVNAEVATCKFTIPYSWTIPVSDATQTVKIQGLFGAVSIGETYAVIGVPVTATLRSTIVAAGSVTAIPSDGATTTFNASAVL